MDKETFMDKPFTILPDAPAMPGAKASPFYVQKEKKGEQKSYRTITHWHDELECLTILDVFMRILANPALLTANEEIREKLVRPLLQNASREYFYIPAGSDDAPKVQRLLRELQASKDSKEPAAPFRTVALIHMLLYYLYRSFPPMLNALPQPSFSDRAVQKDMVHFIYEHYQEKITLADISAAGKVSRSKCCSLFKIYMGSSPIDFVNDYRLEVSRSLLQYTDTSVADIAFNCGFTSQSYFTKLFSRTFHMTPTEFRTSTKKISI